MLVSYYPFDIVGRYSVWLGWKYLFVICFVVDYVSREVNIYCPTHDALPIRGGPLSCLSRKKDFFVVFPLTKGGQTLSFKMNLGSYISGSRSIGNQLSRIG